MLKLSTPLFLPQVNFILPGLETSVANESAERSMAYSLTTLVQVELFPALYAMIAYVPSSLMLR